jgi:dihydroorotate dehydrogenase (NAD+) catalytic subunit
MDTHYLSSAYRAFFRNVVEKLPETPTIAAMRFLFRALPVEKITDYEIRDEKLRTVLRGAYDDLELENPVILAAGYDEPYVLEKALKMGFSAVTAKVSKEPRDGNRNPRIIRTPEGPANSVGYRNQGMVQLREDLEGIRKRMPEGKKIIQNVSDDTIDNYLAVIEYLDTVVDMFEINNCLNYPQSERLDFFEYPDAARDLFGEARNVTKKPLCLKLPRASDFPQIYTETIPMALDNGFTVLNYANTRRMKNRRFSTGLGGLSGPALKIDTVKNVDRISREFGEHADIIGTGGIYSGMWAEMIMREGGAKAVSLITGFAGNPFIAKEINKYLSRCSL